MTDMREQIAALAQAAAREGAPSLMAHVTRSQDGKAKLTITISAASMGIGSDVLTLATKYEASHTDKDGGDIDPVTFDPRQKEIEL